MRISGKDAGGSLSILSDLDLDLDTGRKLKLHEGVNGLGVGVLDVEKPAVGVKLELLAGFLVDESRTVDGEDLLVGGKRNGIGPLTFAPVAFTVSTIFAADLSTSM